MSIFGQLIKSASSTLAGWFEEYAYIVDKGGYTVKPTSNELQTTLSDTIDWCEANDRPIRIIILKPRQKGCSTISVGALFRLLKIRKLRATIIGSGYKQSSNLFKILGTYSKNDSWLKGGICKVLKDVARWANGSECDRLTANDPQAGRSGTYQVVLATEVALWTEDGVSNAAGVLNGLLKTIGFKAGTMVILETTAAGAYGDYYERYQNAVTLEEAKAGKPGYIKVFMPWFVFADSRIDHEIEQIYSDEDLSQHELDYKEKWDLDLAQIAWMRMTLRDECNGDFDKFQQDYPSDEVSAFLMSGRARFSSEGMKWQREASSLKTCEYGVINNNKGRVTWQPSEASSALWMRWEQPRHHRHYLISIDTMTGESQNGGDDPDSHAVKVLRKGYIDDMGRWVRPALVMSLQLYNDGPRRGCWYDIDVLTDHVLRASQYYGNCLIVPEINMDRGMVELLKLEGANIYKREVFNKRKNETMGSYGWQTTTKTRPMIIENLARAIRESRSKDYGEGIEINCSDTIKECESFIRKPNGREEAAQGAHDDQVIGLAIGFQVIDLATMYSEPRVESFIPPEIRRSMSMQQESNYRGGGEFEM